MPYHQLSDGVTDITLPSAMLWTDEFDWDPIAQSEEFTVSGSMVVEVTGELTAGRRITLASWSNGGQVAGAITRATLEAIIAMMAVPEGLFTLHIRGTGYTVMARRGDGPAWEAAQIFPQIYDPGADDLYLVTLRFIEV